MVEPITGAMQHSPEKIKSVEKDRLIMLARNPASVFVFWQFCVHKAESFRLGFYATEMRLCLFYGDDKTPAGEAAFAWDAFKAYLKPPLEGKAYFAALYGVKPDGAYEKLLESNLVILPVSTPLSAGSTADSAGGQRQASVTAAESAGGQRQASVSTYASAEFIKKTVL